MAVGFLCLFAILVGIYLIANFKHLMPSGDVIVSGGASSTISGESAGNPKKEIQILTFKSSDDFKGYLDGGKRAYGDGIFEAQNAMLANLLPQAALADAAKKTAPKTAIKNQKASADEIVASAEAQKFFSLGRARFRQDADIFNIKSPNLFFSPENQFYGSEDGAGETKILDISQPDSIAQSNFIPRDGDFMIVDDYLVTISGNSIFASDISNVNVLQDIWQARISEGTTIIASKAVGKKLYLALKTKIDAANPCPIKPLVFGEKPIIVDCQSIYRPQETILADSIFSVFDVDMASGAVNKNLSFV
ncbi:MAG: hypothetical protein WCX69_02690, partial [Candidatus Paceibacterota bacterium]